MLAGGVEGFFLGTFRTNSWELNFLRTKIFQDLLYRIKSLENEMNYLIGFKERGF